MKISVDTLKCVKLMADAGFSRDSAARLVTSAAELELSNIYSQDEVNAMLSQSVKDTFQRLHEESEQRLARIDRQIELTERRFAERAAREEAQHKAQLSKMAAESAAERKEARRERKEARQEARRESNIHWRWLYGIIITSSVALGGYLSVFITSYLHVH